MLLNQIEIEINLNFFETNLFNIVLIFGFLIYVYNASYKSSLEVKQKEIFKLIEKAEKNYSQSVNFFVLADQFFQQFFLNFCNVNEIIKAKKKELLLLKTNKYKNIIQKKIILSKKLLAKNKANKFLVVREYIIYLILLKTIKKYLFGSTKLKNSILNSIFLN